MSTHITTCKMDKIIIGQSFGARGVRKTLRFSVDSLSYGLEPFDLMFRFFKYYELYENVIDMSGSFLLTSTKL